jgi:hypothetical protein|tara:strand:- start:1443 stop:1688 length:246 start_codon:yes stop_codon:yes gene_type:complete
LKQVAKSIGKPPKELADAPTLDPKLSYLWSIFVALKNSAPDCITYPQITAYMQIYGELSSFEVEAITVLDALHSQEINDYG